MYKDYYFLKNSEIHNIGINQNPSNISNGRLFPIGYHAFKLRMLTF